MQPSIPEPVERSDTDAAWLFYTSGTTGRPKGVVLAARQLRVASLAYLSEVQGVAAGDVMLHPAPLSHGGGLYHLPYVMHAGRQRGAGLGRLRPGRGRRAGCALAQRVVLRGADDGATAGRSRGARSASDPRAWPPSPTAAGRCTWPTSSKRLRVIGPHFAQIYGQGESPMTITVLPRDVINDQRAPAPPRAAWRRWAMRSRCSSCRSAMPTVRCCPPARSARCACAVTS